MKQCSLLLMVLLMHCTTLAQTLTQRLLITDDQDSLLLKADQVTFDQEGNYCFEVKINGHYYYFTSSDTAPVINSIHKLHPVGVFNIANQDQSLDSFYCKNALGVKIYGPIYGHSMAVTEENTSEQIAIVTSVKDSLCYFINGKLYSKIYSKPGQTVERAWIAFSENGNKIFTLEKNRMHYLHVNEQVIDSSKFGYHQLAINNQGDYIYAEGYDPEKPIGRYSYMFFIHANNKKLPHVRTVWNFALEEDGAYFYSGDDNGPYYIAINDILHKHITDLRHVILLDKKHYFFTFTKEGQKKMNVNGVNFTHDFEKILFPAIDLKNNFAYFGKINGNWFKVTNGVVSPDPILRNGIVANPLCISPTGSSLHYFKTEDSVYLYRDEHLLLNPISSKVPFSIIHPRDILPYYREKAAGNGHSLFYIEYNDQWYAVFNGELSAPCIRMKQYRVWNEFNTGVIIAGAFTEDGFFQIQKIGEKKYTVLVNNKRFKEIDGIDQLFYNSCFFSAHQLLFYGLKGNEYYQFTLQY